MLLSLSLTYYLCCYHRSTMSGEYFGFAHIYAFVLTCGVLKLNSEKLQAQANPASTVNPQGKDANAFFALRSCHQVLGGDRGEFFSPDYLCSNPPLWCNYTIVVEHGRRLLLHLEDFTPPEACHLKRDQIHLDEPTGAGGHRVLESCWSRAEYTTRSNALHVILLIGKDPRPPLRGFHARYRALGEPHLKDSSTHVSNRGGATERIPSRPGFGEAPLPTAPPELDFTWAEEHLAATKPSIMEGFTHTLMTDDEVLDVPTWPPTSVHGLGTSYGFSDFLNNEGQLLMEPKAAPTSPPFQTIIHSTEGRSSTRAHVHMNAKVKAGQTVQSKRSNRLEPILYPNIRECLYEVAVEIPINLSRVEDWGVFVKSLQVVLENMIRDEVRSRLQPKALSCERVKRLRAGVLFILWLQFGEDTEDALDPQWLVGTLHKLLDRAIRLHANKPGSATVASVTVEDVNECGTQLVLCDINADCVNHFGSYACRCRPGFEDFSRLGSGGTLCVKRMGREDSQVPVDPVLLRSLYGVCFLLCTFLFLLLFVAAVLYRRHHSGTFRMDDHNGAGLRGSYALPPPPIQRPDSWSKTTPTHSCPNTELPLLGFRPLVPPHHPGEGDKL